MRYLLAFVFIFAVLVRVAPHCCAQEPRKAPSCHGEQQGPVQEPDCPCDHLCCFATPYLFVVASLPSVTFDHVEFAPQKALLAQDVERRIFHPPPADRLA